MPGTQHRNIYAVLCLVAQSCLTLCDPMDCSLPGSSVHGDSPGRNTGVGCHYLLQGIFLTQVSNLCLLLLYHEYRHGPLRWSSGKEPTCQCRRPGFDPWVGGIPCRRAWQSTPVFLPGESPGTEEPGGLQSMGLHRVGHD